MSCQEHLFYIFPCHEMEKDSEVPKYIVANDIFDNAEPIVCPCFIKAFIFYSDGVELLTYSEIKHPMDKANIITWVEPMPESANHYCPLLCFSLDFLPRLLIFVSQMRFINILIYISFQSHLYTHIPRVCFYLQTGIKEKRDYFRCLNFSEILFFFPIA